MFIEAKSCRHIAFAGLVSGRPGEVLETPNHKTTANTLYRYHAPKILLDRACINTSCCCVYAELRQVIPTVMWMPGFDQKLQISIQDVCEERECRYHEHVLARTRNGRTTPSQVCCVCDARAVAQHMFLHGQKRQRVPAAAQ